MTSKADISDWLEQAKSKNATHMIVVCDTYDWDDYPVFVSPNQDVRQVESQYSRDMQKVMEIYRLDMDWAAQLSQPRARNY